MAPRVKYFGSEVNRTTAMSIGILRNKLQLQFKSIFNSVVLDVVKSGREKS